tara:strand:- start:1075 stop:1521 length:447 start_codon:yes stop_codon:yes gene_type:complete
MTLASLNGAPQGELQYITSDRVVDHNAPVHSLSIPQGAVVLVEGPQLSCLATVNNNMKRELTRTESLNCQTDQAEKMSGGEEKKEMKKEKNFGIQSGLDRDDQLSQDASAPLLLLHDRYTLSPVDRARVLGAAPLHTFVKGNSLGIIA